MPKEDGSDTTPEVGGGGGTLALNVNGGSGAPLCRCRVLYIGSAVPTVTKDGLQGIQQPLKERYPSNESTETKGIDSWLSVWSNGLLLEYADGSKRTESAFFSIVTLHYCAAVRYVNVGEFAIEGGGERFIPLDTPFAYIPNSPHPPIFAAIFRRTTGIKVLECHAFICTNERAANALVRCCFHAYADTIYLKMDDKLGALNIAGLKSFKDSGSRSATPTSEMNFSEREESVATAAIDEMREEANWNERAIGQKTWQRRQQNGEYDSSSLMSSLYKTRKNTGLSTKKRESSVFENGKAIMPYIGPHIQRAGSQPDIYELDYYGHYEYAPRSVFGGFVRSPGPPGMMFNRFYPPPPGMFGGFPPPLPGVALKKKSGKRSKKQASAMPLPPQFFGQPTMVPPNFIPPSLHFRYGFTPMSPIGRFGTHRVPPPPRFYFAGPPHMAPMPLPPFGSPAYFAMVERARHAATLTAANAPSADYAPAGSGPIIETIYDTFPRNRISHHPQSTYEEPIYMPSNRPDGSSYRADLISAENYESFYDTHRQRNEQKNHSGSDSDASGEGSPSVADRNHPSANRFWEAYEASVYRKTHLNEKAFAKTVGATDRNNNNSNSHGKVSGRQNSNPRPSTPPADYDYENSGVSTPATGAKPHATAY